jgi:flavin reductase (DIM6/NTAB) family NADH-FMN oxidoreductase RutF
VVVTAAGVDGPLGFTCQTFGSLSLEPLLVSFSARAASKSWPQIRKRGQMAVNVLAAHQESIARAFATSASDKFDGVAWGPGINGAPLIAGALAHLEVRLIDVANFGDHDVAVAAVEAVDSSDGAPLVYYRGGFGSFLA